MNKLTSFMIFITGVVVGSLVTWQYAKKTYEQEVFSKRERVGEEDTDGSVAEVKVTKTKEKPSIVDYTAKLREHGYTDYSDVSAGNEEKGKVDHVNEPYIIPPEEFGESDEYEKISLTYYADKVLVDDNDDIIDNVDEIVGLDFLNHFGEYEDDSVFVRNDELQCDYEILLDLRKYSDVTKTKPRWVEEP